MVVPPPSSGGDGNGRGRRASISELSDVAENRAASRNALMMRDLQKAAQQMKKIGMAPAAQEANPFASWLMNAAESVALPQLARMGVNVSGAPPAAEGPHDGAGGPSASRPRTGRSLSRDQSRSRRSDTGAGIGGSPGEDPEIRSVGSGGSGSPRGSIQSFGSGDGRSLGSDASIASSAGAETERARAGGRRAWNTGDSAVVETARPPPGASTSLGVAGTGMGSSRPLRSAISMGRGPASAVPLKGALSKGRLHPHNQAQHSSHHIVITEPLQSPPGAAYPSSRQHAPHGHLPESWGEQPQSAGDDAGLDERSGADRSAAGAGPSDLPPHCGDSQQGPWAASELDRSHRGSGAHERDLEEARRAAANAKKAAEELEARCAPTQSSPLAATPYSARKHGSR